MCGDSWYISEEDLDEYQRAVLNEAPTDESFIVTGCAGSGKTNLAIWKAQEIQANERGSYYLIVYTKALRIFIEDGLENAELDEENVMHYQRWKNMGKPSADYIIVDEAQDFSEDEIRLFHEKANVACILYGDANQQIYEGFPQKEDLIDFNDLPYNLPTDIAENFPRFFDLRRNHRLPKKVARVAGQMINEPDMEYQCSDEGNYKPVIKELDSLESELDSVMQRISSDHLTHVGIFHPYRQKVKDSYNLLRNRNHDVHIRIDDDGLEITPQELDFNLSDVPKLCTYHSAKGLQFHNVFLVDCSLDFYKFYPALFVALTRTCDRLFIYHSEGLSPYLYQIDQDLFDYEDDFGDRPYDILTDELPF